MFWFTLTEPIPLAGIETATVTGARSKSLDSGMGTRAKCSPTFPKFRKEVLNVN